MKYLFQSLVVVVIVATAVIVGPNTRGYPLPSPPAISSTFIHSACHPTERHEHLIPTLGPGVLSSIRLGGHQPALALHRTLRFRRRVGQSRHICVTQFTLSSRHTQRNQKCRDVTQLHLIFVYGNISFMSR